MEACMVPETQTCRVPETCRYACELQAHVRGSTVNPTTPGLAGAGASLEQSLNESAMCSVSQQPGLGGHGLWESSVSLSCITALETKGRALGNRIPEACPPKGQQASLLF